MNIIMIDDDVEFTDMVGEYLRSEGDLVFTAINDGASGAEEVINGQYDLVLLDVTMPTMNGFDVLKKIRAVNSIPVIMLTARGDDMDRIIGLEVGADDYLPKPCNLRELTARIRAVLRRSSSIDNDEGRVQQGDLVLDKNARSVVLQGTYINLTSAEFALLEKLLETLGQPVSKDDLARHALGRRSLPYDRSIDTHVGNLRKKIGSHANGQPRIRTVRGRGYAYTVAS